MVITGILGGPPIAFLSESPKVLQWVLSNLPANAGAEVSVGWMKYLCFSSWMKDPCI